MSEFAAAVCLSLLSFLLVVMGVFVGEGRGQKKACESVKLEWVQDKCMKVTREAV